MPFDQDIRQPGTESRSAVFSRLSGPITKLTFSIALILLLFLTHQPARALAYTVEKHDDPVTGQFVISPTKVELDVKQGDIISRNIEISNRTGSTLTIEFSVEDFEGSSDPSQATVFKGDEDSAWGARRWLQPEISSIVLKQGETVNFKTKIVIPKDAEAGGHYAALFASSTYASENGEGSAINITSRVGSLFLIRVEGAVVEVGSLEKPEVPPFSEYGPINIGLVFNNQGNVHLKPSGHVFVTNFLGQTVADIPVPEWVVLPESVRRSVVTWDSKYLFGRYTARAEIGYTEDGSPIIVSTTFWVIPWKIILGISAVIIAIIALVSWLVRRRRGERRELQEELADLRAAKVTSELERADISSGPLAGEKQMVALNELFPSMGDAGTVDLRDEETQALIRDIIGQEVDLGRTFIGEGRIEEARAELEEARAAARRIGLLAVIGMIDDLLREI
ncbi:MAG: hypothetical protein M1539_01605 [Actinobacteria bacterium]|nr:hypothetical protein [Actinomycetota bacterium]MCL5882669.1 hypothetical protein [Actinomycetota bacterium]